MLLNDVVGCGKYIIYIYLLSILYAEYTISIKYRFYVATLKVTVEFPYANLSL